MRKIVHPTGCKLFFLEILPYVLVHIVEISPVFASVETVCVSYTLRCNCEVR